MNLRGLVHVNVNCSHSERFRAFHEMLSVEVSLEVPEVNPPEVAAAVGSEIIAEPATVVWDERPSSRFVCIKDPDGTVLELAQDLTSRSTDEPS